MQLRENVLHTWIKNICGNISYTLTPLAGDASFRRYYRLVYENHRYIVMDAPPENEAIAPFVDIANILKQSSVSVPDIHHKEPTLGFLLLDDFGDRVFLNSISKANASALYQSALQTLSLIQQTETNSLPLFDKNHMMQEMGLFTTWFLRQYLSLTLSAEEEGMIQKTMEYLAEALSLQPQVFIHRDYHSRNLMVLNDNTIPGLGVLDFQDAMKGPATYDLVSILKDCYIEWPKEQVLDWADSFRNMSPFLTSWSRDNFMEAFDLCGLQRHLKVLGIFSRLYLRDNKPGYLRDLPLTLRYVQECTSQYEALLPLHDFIKRRVQLP